MIRSPLMRWASVPCCSLSSSPPPTSPPTAITFDTRPCLSAAAPPAREAVRAAPCSAREPGRHCPCGRRHLLATSAAAALLPLPTATAGPSGPADLVDKFHPARPDWYEELYAAALKDGMRSYEAEIAGYKEELFSHLKGKNHKEVVELGVGTGPNFKYYVSASSLHVIGVDPNKQMEKYARKAAVAAGLPLNSFSFIRGVGESLAIEDASVDAVIGTLVLCSVRDVDLSLKEVKRILKPGGVYLFIEHVLAHDGSLVRFTQTILDPLQQFVADGCHLTRDTGKNISDAGFSSLNINTTFLSTISFISPHIYGFACK